MQIVSDKNIRAVFHENFMLFTDSTRVLRITNKEKYVHSEFHSVHPWKLRDTIHKRRNIQIIY